MPISISLIITIFTLLAIALGTLKGINRGVSRQVIRLATNAVAIFLSVLISKKIYLKVDGFFDGKTVADIQSWISGLGFVPESVTSWIVSFDMETIENILYIPLTLVALPLIFTSVFLVLNGLVKIIYAVICGLAGLTKRKNNAATRAVGGVLGAVQGLIVAGMILLPIIGVVNVASRSVTTINEGAKEENVSITLTNVYDTYVKEAADNIFVKTYSACGVDALYNAVVTLNVNGLDTNMAQLFPDVANIYSEAAKLRGTDWKKLTPENQEQIKKIAALAEENKYLSNILAGVVRGASHAYDNGNIKINLEPSLQNALVHAIEIFHTTTPETLHEDIDVILNVYFILSDGDVIYAIGTESKLIDTFTAQDENGDTVISKVMSELDAHPRTRPIVDLVAKVALSAMKDKIGLDEETEVLYENVKGGLVETLAIDKSTYQDDEEYIEAVSESINQTLTENGIEIEPEMVDTMANYVNDNYEELNIESEDSLNKILISYYDAYIEYMNSSETPEDIVIPGVTP